jgi:hypothetical protein
MTIDNAQDAVVLEIKPDAEELTDQCVAICKSPVPINFKRRCSDDLKTILC